MHAYTVQTYGGQVQFPRSFRIDFHTGLPPTACLIWKPDNSGKVALTLFFGPSGSGKSTFLGVLYNKLRSQAVRSDLDFHFVPSFTEGASSVAFIPQQAPMVQHWQIRDLLPTDTIFGDCFFPARDVTQEMKRWIGDFSGGQQRKLYAWSALERLAREGERSSFLILDETFDGLGADEAKRCLEAIRERWSSKLQKPLHILLVTHLSRSEILSNPGNAHSLRLTVVETRSEELSVNISEG